MYLPFIQDLIQLECQNSEDSHEDVDSKRDSALVNPTLSSISSLVVNVGSFPPFARRLSQLALEASAWGISEPHDIRQPTSNIPSILVTPADSTEPPMHARVGEKIHQRSNQYGLSSCNIRTTPGFEPSSSPYCSSETIQQHKSATEGHNEWFCHPLEAVYKSNRTIGVPNVRQLMACAELQSCPAENSMVLWRPTNIDQQPRLTDDERSYNITQPTVYPFHTKRNSI